MDEVKQDTTVPGGKYAVGGNWVDANGEVLGPINGKKAPAKQAPAKTGDQTPPVKTLEDFTVPQLQKAATAYTVSLEGKTLKPDIIQALVAAEVSPEDVEAAQAG
jgi:hypothetical protein